MAHTSESAFGQAVMQVLATQPNHEATVRTLIKHVPDYLTLTDEDRAPSPTREHEEVWEQRVRNLKSHDKIVGNVIGEGYVQHVSRGRYRLTDSGEQHLKNKGLI